MLKWAPYPFLRVAFFLCAGIFTYVYLGNLPDFILPLFVFFLMVYVALWAFARLQKSGDLNNMAGLSALLAIFSGGLLLAHLHTAKVYPHNIAHVNTPIQFYEGVVDDYITRKPNTISTTLALTRVKTARGWQAASGNVRLTIAKENQSAALNYGDVLLIKGAPVPVPPPANPAQFDYRRYLAHQQVYHQQYLNSNQFLITGHQPGFTLIKWSIQIRNFLDRQLRKNIPSAREYGIATALVLGIKDYLPDDIKATYANTGTMHVLAVSGLHVALLFYILNLLIGKWSQKLGYRVVSFILLLGFIWMYAFITALSASVLRAVVMFTFILIADSFRKQTNIYNTLSAAAFFLLLFNPYYLFEVGFQLSFLAVFGIVYVQPKIYRWLDVEGRVPDFLWKLISTSVAAQVAVLPLSFYYFHQFPVYFLLANIIAIPLANIALILGFVLLMVCWLPVLPALLGVVLDGCLSLMNYLSNALLKFPLAVIDDISITQTQTWMLYAILIVGLIFLARKKLSYFAVFTLLILVFSGWQVADARSRRQQLTFIIYQVPRSTAMGFITGNEATLLADSAFYANPKNHQYAVKPHWVKWGIRKTEFDTLTSAASAKQIASYTLADGNQLIRWNGKTILLVQRPFKKYVLASIKPDFLVLSKNAYVAPGALPNKTSEMVVILTGANNNWYINKMKTIFTQLHIPVHDTKEKGAWLVSAFND